MEFVKSLFYSVNFLSPVRITQEQLEKWHTNDEDVKKVVNNQFADEGLQKAFSEPLTLNPHKFNGINKKFEAKGWNILSSKPVMDSLGKPTFNPYYSVLEHDNLFGKVVKHAGKRKPDDQIGGGAHIGICGDFLDLSTYCSFLRIAMAERIRKIVEENPDELDGITLPQKELCEIQPGRLKDKSLPLDQRFLIVAEKVACLSESATVDAIDKMTREEQVALADKLVSVIQKAGLADASFGNIRLGNKEDRTEKGNRKIYLIDTEPSNVMILDQGWFKNLFTLQSSLEQTGRIGAVQLLRLEGSNRRANHFVGRVRKHIAMQKTSRYSASKVSLYVISVIALTIIYQKKVLEKKFPGLFEKYGESYPIKALKAIEIQRKTYLMSVAAPLEIGIAKFIGFLSCFIIQQVKTVSILNDNSLSEKEKIDKALSLPWAVRAAHIQGQARLSAYSRASKTTCAAACWVLRNL